MVSPFMLTTGPVMAYPEVLCAMAAPVPYDYDPAYQKLFETVALKAQHAMGTTAPPLILQGEPVLGLEAAAASLIKQDDVVLNLASGVYGKGFAFWAARYAERVDEIEVAYNTCIDPETVRAHLAAHPETSVVSVCHHDTPSGTLNDIDAIGEICEAAGALMIVDAVSSWAGMDTSPVASKAGIYVTGPNKCLGCPPGLTLAAVSDVAWTKIEANADAPRTSILSLWDWKNAWMATEPFPFTTSVTAIRGLDAALDRYFAEGPENVWARHALTAHATRDGLQAMGVELWPIHESLAAPTCTVVRLPDGVHADSVTEAARAQYGVTFVAGRGDQLSNTVRIGHMGPMAQQVVAHIAIAALGGALKANGATLDIGAGLTAAQARLDSGLERVGG